MDKAFERIFSAITSENDTINSEIMEELIDAVNEIQYKHRDKDE